MTRSDHDADKKRVERELAEQQVRREEEPFLPPLELTDGAALQEPTLIRMQRQAVREHLQSLVVRVRAFERVVGRIDRRLVGRAGRDSLRHVQESARAIIHHLSVAESDVRRD